MPTQPGRRTARTSSLNDAAGPARLTAAQWQLLTTSTDEGLEKIGIRQTVQRTLSLHHNMSLTLSVRSC